MSVFTTASPEQADNHRHMSLRFLNWGHFLDHYVILIFPTVVLGLEAVYHRGYGDLLALSTAAFTAFGLFALPCGWLADHWSRRNMMAIYFLGTGLSCIAVGLSPDFLTLAIALFAVGVFAAIYHPVGIPMVIDAAITRGRTMAFNGVCGNIGVSVAAGITAQITVFLGWRAAFFVPAAVFLITGVAYLKLVPNDSKRQVPRVTAQDVTLDKRLLWAVIVLFMTLALSSGLVFNALTITLPKIVDARMGQQIPLWLVGALSTLVFLAGGAAQLTVGRVVERTQPHYLIAGVALVQLIGVVWMTYATGWPLLVALAVAIASVYAQVTVNDIVLARYTPPALRGRIYALRFGIIFTSAGPAVWGIGKLYDYGGFDLVLLITAIIAGIYTVNSLIITAFVASVEGKRARAAAAPAE
ncbi:MAG: MFS transporter [Xanthobacteraceae bacterium]